MQTSACCKPRDRLLKAQIKVLEEDLLHPETIDDHWKNRVAWRSRIHIADPDNVGNEP